MKAMKYQIRFQHISWEYATSRKSAIQAVKSECGQNRLYYADAPDGLYCYTSHADKQRDDTGEHAYAVICGPDQQGE